MTGAELNRLASDHASALESLLQPKERFNELRAVTRSRFGPGVFDLSYPNQHDGPDEDVRRALRLAVEASDDDEEEAGSPYGGDTITRRQVATWLNRDYGLPFAYRDVVLTPGATAALNIVFRTLFGPEDEVVVLTPCWFDYPVYLRNLGIPIRFVRLRDDKHLDLAAISRALTSKTRGILLSDPCCPTGIVYSKDEMQGLSALLSRTEEILHEPIYLISDEVHRRLTWNLKEFHSPLLSYARSLAVYSFGSELFVQGQRIGYVAVSPRMPERDDVRARLERATRIMGFGAPSSMVLRAVRHLLDHHLPLDFVAARQKATRSSLKAFGYEVCDGDAGFFVYVKAPIADDFKFAEMLAAQGVLILPSTLFHEQGYFRISVALSTRALQEALPAFQRVLFLL
jgi:aspartate aminotransferase